MAISEKFHIKNEFIDVEGDEVTKTSITRPIFASHNDKNETATTVQDDFQVFDEDFVKTINLNITEDSLSNTLISFKVSFFFLLLLHYTFVHLLILV